MPEEQLKNDEKLTKIEPLEEEKLPQKIESTKRKDWRSRARKNPKNVRVHFKIDEQTNELLEKNVDDFGFDTRTSYLTSLIKGKRYLYDPSIQKMLVEINKIGVNLNQIAKHLNENAGINVMLIGDFGSIKKDVEAMRKALLDCVKSTKK